MPLGQILLFAWKYRKELAQLVPIIIEIYRALKGASATPLLDAMKEVVRTGKTEPVTELHTHVVTNRVRP